MSIHQADLETAARAIRGEARSRGFKRLVNREQAYAMWDEISRTKPKTVAAAVYRDATSWHIDRVLAMALKSVS